MDILIVGETDSDNLGDQAIHLTLRRLFESAGHRVRGWDLSRGRYSRFDRAAGRAVARSDRDGSGAGLKSRLVASLERGPVSLRRLAVVLSKKRAYLRRRRAWAEAIGNHDLVVFGGGALLMDNDLSFPLGLAHLARVARRVGRPYACVGCSTGSEFSWLGRRWLREFLDGCSFIALRDSRSLDGLRTIGDYDAAVYADSALLLNTIYRQPPARGDGQLGVNVISKVTSARLRGRVYDSYMDELAEFVRRLGDESPPRFKEIVLFGTGEEGDFAAAERFLARSEVGSAGIPVRVEPRPGSLEALAATVASFDLVVSTRMHAGIIAKSYRVPLIAVGWDRKIRGFCEMIGIEADFFDIEACRADTLLQAVGRLGGAQAVQTDRVEKRLLELSELPGRVAASANQQEK